MMAPYFVESRDWVEAFWGLVNKIGEPGYAGVPCWNWTGNTSEGYGALTAGGCWERCHRLSWLLANGEPGEGYVLHHCDNRSCVNPQHLFLGTHADNMRDAVRKGRIKVPRPNNAGDRNGRSKLTADKVRAIRKTLATRPDLTQDQVGEIFAVAGNTVCRIATGKTWRSVT